ncbi:ATP-binding protein [Clostridium sp. DMHC 10]|nr:ATP-binding protein [Clostridium sp. DMHC 10]
MGINKIKIALDEFSVDNGISSNLVYIGMMNKITHIQWKVIYDNLEEALTNVLKYSKAAQVTVKIDVLSKFVKVEIKDNGVGAKSIKKSLGIMGMEERCSKLHGKVIVDGSKGFSVIIILPLEEG